MNAYLISQLPLLAGFAALLLLSVVRPKAPAGSGVDQLSHLITLVALGLAAALTAGWLMPGEEFFGGAIRVTLIGRAVAITALSLAFGAALLAGNYLGKAGARAPEFRMVILAQALGLYHLPLAGDLATLFIAFELVSVPSYVLAGFNFRDARANEAGMKYLLLGALASALFLLGLSFLYGATGELHLTAIRDSIGAMLLDGGDARIVLAKTALAFLLTALLFKVAAAPFHFWLPDVYQGTNLASLAFIASPAKVALFGLAALLLWGPFAYLHETWKPLLLAAALLSALFGNFQAIAQKNLKRLLAFSSVVNAGFLLLSLFLDSAAAFLLYLAAYGVTVIGALATFMALGTRGADVDDVADLNGLGRKRPWFAAVLTLMLFSLAGIPITAGFAAKFSVAAGAFAPGYAAAPGFVAVLVASIVLSLVSFSFYFRMVRALWFTPPAQATEEPRESVAVDAGVIVACLAASLLVVVLGVLMRAPGLP
jgi:NADH-quinone oxidoreductase subunit N